MFGTGSLWRQGSVLTSESVKALNVSSQHDALVVVISHDCDLANTAETFSEAIICKKISNVDGNYSNGRNARKLHLSIVTKEGATLNLELEHSNRMQISQSSIGEVGQPSDSEAVVGEEKRILKHWLASRYDLLFPRRLKIVCETLELVKRTYTHLLAAFPQKTPTTS
jgi:hypothetical protein